MRPVLTEKEWMQVIMSIGNNTDEELYVSDDIEATWRDFGKIPQPSKNLVETTSQKIPQTETEII